MSCMAKCLSILFIVTLDTILLVVTLDTNVQDDGEPGDSPDFSTFGSRGRSSRRGAVFVNGQWCRNRMGNCGFYKKYCKSHPKQINPRCPASCGICQCGKAPRRNDGAKEKQIVSGKDADPGYYPWQVAIYHDDFFICGGSLIDKKYILTAAHCVNGLENEFRKFKITLGSHNRAYPLPSIEQTVFVKRITVHKNFDRLTLVNDIAVLELKSEAKLSDYVQPICLPAVGEVRKAGSYCRVTGWGKPYAGGKAVNILQEISYPIVNVAKCQKRNNRGGSSKKVNDKMVCAGYDDGRTFKSACHGDSGGPLACRDKQSGKWKLFGIVSWGSQTCNVLEKFNVFTEVSEFITWINEERVK